MKLFQTSFICRRLHSLSKKFIVSPIVQCALMSKKGVVALESTVITHGLPYPQNLETAKSLEEIVRKEGCEPATIALIDGNVHIGLTKGELSRIANSKDSMKVSRRDIAYALNKQVIGGTTVAATMYLAHLAGIRVFATGGIGGVHRGADQTFDISADLIELANTPVVVVCAGVKSILDIRKTVEFLETHSVNCIVYGQRNNFPGFFTRETSTRGQFNTEDLAEVAQIVETSMELGLQAGTVLGCPIPKEFQADGNKIEEAVQMALKEAKERKIQSKDVTPFILDYVNKMTSGASMKTNIALLKNNARIGARLAKLLAGPKNSSRVLAKPPMEQCPEKSTHPKIVVVGASIVDFESVTTEEVKNDGGSYVGKVTQRCGGVGRNHADAITRMGCDVSLVSAIGNDSNGKYLFEQCPHIDWSRVEIVQDIPTAVYMSVNVKGDVQFGISSIGEIVNRITPELILRNEDVISKADYVLFDGNIPEQSMAKIVELTNFYKTNAWFEPTDIFKATKIFTCNAMDRIQVISPNANEFLKIVERNGIHMKPEILSSPNLLCEFICDNEKLMHRLNLLVVTLSSNGVAVVSRNPDGTLLTRAYAPPLAREKIISVSGAGDSLNSGILAGLAHGYPLEKCLRIGNECAALTLQTVDAISSKISPHLLLL